jgi:hypothetical protein
METLTTTFLNGGGIFRAVQVRLLPQHGRTRHWLEIKQPIAQVQKTIERRKYQSHDRKSIKVRGG